MADFTLNGQKVHALDEDNLLDFLRDQARLTSVKNGCGDGACGACTILVDGKNVRACRLTAAKVDGKTILTVEGLSQREKEIYAWAFAEAGAVQCGFCTPGMVMSAKALLNVNLYPSPEEIKKALKNNICRCTGYIKIEEAVLLAAGALRDGTKHEEKNTSARVGNRCHRVDAGAKTLGTADYVDDMYVEGMLYGAVLRTKYPRALIKSIDISKAKRHPDVEVVLTAENIPGNRIDGYLVKDWPVLVAPGEETRYVGDALAILAARSKKAAQEALELIRVDYEELPPITTPADALKENAPKLHPGGNILKKTYVKRGDPEEAIAKSKHVVRKVYKTPFVEHAFLEPESALAVPDPDGGLTVYVGTQSVYHDMHSMENILGKPHGKVKVICKYVGGAFGGKEDLSVQHHAALLACAAQKPVKLTLSRRESLFVHPKRHAMEIEVTTACDEEGNLTAMVAKILADTGAYASLGGPVLERACTHACGPYRIPHIELTGLGVYTNNPPAGAFRGFGVAQSAFAGESNLDILAERVGLSPWEIRYKNALNPGDSLPVGQIADDSTAIKETLLAVRDAYESSPYTGIACAIKNAGLGVGVPDTGRAKLIIVNGKVQLQSAATCIGQGIATILTQIVCETTGLDKETVEVAPPNTVLAPDSGATTGSRQTLFTGEAVRQASLYLAESLKRVPLAQLEGQEFYGEFVGVTDPLGSEKEHPVNHVAYSYATQVVVLDQKGKVEKVIAAHDIGKAINPVNVEGQIEGGVAMGLGYALREDFPLKDAVPTAKFGTLGLFRSLDMPEVECILVEKNKSPLAYGAKGIGEICTIPTAPAVASAYYKLDGTRRCTLPLKDTFYRPKKSLHRKPVKPACSDGVS
ncbi:selenium-dependent xanthine dehydrogenase [Candidatus Formimonas warabiya]|uniref:selenium-dependent xanthine dehydrogenase n=1 Tax=Formimonas warabiya TaxID=1761012 RepID=UPI0011D06CBE|nr:selenium-dependent xanthine dehydrogenase [Candidatus Formimonas warabiya]